jgi:hypothetical protein
MSGRSKRIIRDRIAARVLNGDITLSQGQSILKAAGASYKGQKAKPAAAKSAAPPQRDTAGTDMLYKSYGPGLTGTQRNYLEIYHTHSNGAVREAAYKAAFPEEKKP